MNYFMSSWDDHSKAKSVDVFKVSLKLKKNLGKSASVLGAASVSGKKQDENTGDKCPKHLFLFHQWTKYDLNPNTIVLV